MSERIFHQISKQYQSGHQEPTVLVRRSNDTIQTARVTDVTHEGKRYVKFTDPASGEERYKGLSFNSLSDEAQAKLAYELGVSVGQSEVIEDTLPREIVMGRYEQLPAATQALGKVAVTSEVIAGAGSPHEVQKNKDNIVAQERILKIIGDGAPSNNILSEILRSAGETPDEIRRALADKQNHQDLREQVFSVLSRRMADLLAEGGHFHERVQANNPNNLKAPEGNHGYEEQKYRSDEYVVLLALAKLDGSFDVTRERNNYTDYPSDHSSQGQHRQASDTLLKNFMDDDATETGGERVVSTDPVVIEAKQSIDVMVDDLRSRAHMNEEQLDNIDRLIQAEEINLNAVDEQTDALMQQVYKMYDVFEQSIEALQQLRNSVDDATLENIKQRHAIESLELAVRRELEQFSKEFAVHGIGLIDQKTTEARYDRHMDVEYRSYVAQTTARMREVQQRVLESVQDASRRSSE